MGLKGPPAKPLPVKPVDGVITSGSIACTVNCKVFTTFIRELVTMIVALDVPSGRLSAAAFRLIVTLVVALAANVPLVADALNHADVLTSDHDSGDAAELVRV